MTRPGVLLHTLKTVIDFDGDSMKLFGYYRSSASYRIRIVLNLKQLDYEYVPVALDKGEQLQAEHALRNPLGLVPVLQTAGTQLAESVAITEYLEALHPDPALLPGDELERARVREMQHIISSSTQPLTNLRVLKHVAGHLGGDQAEWAKYWMARGFDAFEKRAKERSTDGRYAFGDRATVADIWLMPQVYNAERWGLDMSPFPTITSIVQHCSSIEAFAAAHPAVQPDAPADA